MAPRRLPWRAMPYEPQPYVAALGAQGPAIERVGKAQLHDLMGNFAAATMANSLETETNVARYREAFRSQVTANRDRLLNEVYGSVGAQRAAAFGEQNARNVGAGVVQYINNNFGAGDLANVLGTTARNWPALLPDGSAALAQSFSAVVPFLSAGLAVAEWWQHRDDEQEQREAAVNSASWLRHWLKLLNERTLVDRFGVSNARARVRSVWSAPLLDEINRPLYARAASLAVEYCRQGQARRGIGNTGGCRRGVHGVGNRAATEVLGLPFNFAGPLSLPIPLNENTVGEVKDSISKVWAGIMNVGAEATPAAVTEAVQARPVKRGAPTRERAAEVARRRADAARARGKRGPPMSRAAAAQAANRREKEARKAARRAAQSAASSSPRSAPEAAPVSESSTGPALLAVAFLAAALMAKK